MEPNNIQQIPELPEEFTYKGRADNYQDGISISDRVIVFGTEAELNHFSESNRWYINGTICTALKRFIVRA